MPEPVLAGQHIGRAHLATRALLERQLDGLPFPAWTALNLVGQASGPLTADACRAALGAGLKIDEPAAAGVVDQLAGLGLVVTRGGVVGLTSSGQEVFERVTAAIARIVATLYGDIPEEDQVVTRRVLDLIKVRADAALAHP